MIPAERPIITFLTDFGLDGAAGTCRGVMAGICRDAQIIDISHTVRKYAIRDGAFILRSAIPYLPIAVHVGVVDPGVGTSRRPIAIRAGRGDVLIGPDNGLLLPAADAIEGVTGARELTNRDLWLPTTSATFHGRDVFAPVAAHLAAGDATFESVGPTLEPEDLVRLPAALATATAGHIDTEITYVDSFGNLRLAGGQPELESAFGTIGEGDLFSIAIGAAPLEHASFARTFGAVEVGAAVLYIDSSGDLAIGANQATLAARVNADGGMPVRIERA